MPRDRAERFSSGGQGLARDVAGVLRAGIIRLVVVRPSSRSRPKNLL
jgi:hypothetical protein